MFDCPKVQLFIQLTDWLVKQRGERKSERHERLTENVIDLLDKWDPKSEELASAFPYRKLHPLQRIPQPEILVARNLPGDGWMYCEIEFYPRGLHFQKRTFVTLPSLWKRW